MKIAEKCLESFPKKKKNMCAPKQKKTPEASKTTKPTFCLKVALFLLKKSQQNFIQETTVLQLWRYASPQGKL